MKADQSMSELEELLWTAIVLVSMAVAVLLLAK